MRKPRLQIALLGLWLGIAGLFSFVVAPAAFAVLPTQQLAGQMVSRVLSGVEIAGVCLGLALLLLSYGRQKRVSVIEVGLSLLLTASMAISRLLVSPRLHAIREQFGDQLAALPSGDPVRSTFDLLHKLSVVLLSISLLGATVMMAILIWRGSSR